MSHWIGGSSLAGPYWIGSREIPHKSGERFTEGMESTPKHWIRSHIECEMLRWVSAWKSGVLVDVNDFALGLNGWMKPLLECWSI